MCRAITYVFVLKWQHGYIECWGKRTRSLLVKNHQIWSVADQTLGADTTPAADELSGNAMNSITTYLDSSSVGVALYDQRLDCKAVNAALTRMVNAIASASARKTIYEIIWKGALELEVIFQRVWESGNSFSNLPLTARFSAGAESARWLVNLFPVKDEAGRIRLVAATFFEVTRRSSVELHFSRLKTKFKTAAPGQSNPYGEEFMQLSTRTLNLVKQSVELLKCSMSLRRRLSEARVRNRLMRQAQFLSGTQRRKPGLCIRRPRPISPVAPSLPLATTFETEIPSSCPSPRERQVLYLLADGKSNKEIGAVLEISTRTVEFYRARIMLKLDLHSTAALVRYAVRNNIVEA